MLARHFCHLKVKRIALTRKDQCDFFEAAGTDLASPGSSPLARIYNPCLE